MYKHIITYRFSDTENDPDYQKRRAAFLYFLQQHDFFDVDTMSTVFVKSDYDVVSLVENLQKYIIEEECPFKDDDEVMIVTFKEDEYRKLRHRSSLKLNGGEVDEVGDYKWW